MNSLYGNHTVNQRKKKKQYTHYTHAKLGQRKIKDQCEKYVSKYGIPLRKLNYDFLNKKSLFK